MVRAVDVSQLRVSNWISAYETPQKNIVRAQLQFAGERGTYVAPNVSGEFGNVRYDNRFVDAQGNRTAAIHGRWRLGGQTGYFVFRQPDNSGLSDGYWGYYQADGSHGPIVGSWDARLVSFERQFDVAAAQLKVGENGLQLRPEAIQGADNIMPIAFLEEGMKMAGAIGRVAFSENFVDPSGSRGRKGDPIGTCFLVAPSLVMTARHIVPKNSEVRAEFGALACEFSEDPVAQSEEWDYALYSIDSENAGGPMPVPLKVTAGISKQGTIQFMPDEPVVVIHFPGGSEKKITVFDSKIQDADLCRDVLLYSTDTNPGSSGAPVLNQFWNVIALHRGPIEYSRGNARSQANYGSRIDRIVEDLARQLRDTERGRRVLTELGINVAP
jgi:endonuclease G